MKCISCKKEIMNGMVYCPFCNAKQSNGSAPTPSKMKTIGQRSIQNTPSDNKQKENTPYTVKGTTVPDTEKEDNLILEDFLDTVPEEILNETDDDYVNHNRKSPSSNEKKEDSIPPSYNDGSLDFDESNNEQYEEDNWLPADSDSVVENLNNMPVEIEEQPSTDKATSPVKKKRSASRSKTKIKIDEQKENPVNKDGYYDDIQPVKEEPLPVSKGEFIAKIIFLILTVILIVLFLIYFIQ